MSDQDYNVTSPKSETPSGIDPLWLRILYMAFLAFLGYLAFWAALATGLVQLTVKLVSRDINPELDAINKALVRYLHDCMTYVTFTGDEKPFPFRPFSD